MTYDELQTLLPDAHIETNDDDELVIWTGLAINPDDQSGELIDFESLPDAP